ncbi:MAG: DUF929 domain-containing protein [Thermoplasmata archaeon]|nr:DUF929 domain-containing protein [Thermoplasmata archaeon]
MVDWERVEKLRANGWDWARIADDPRVGFRAESTEGDPGRALRALYYQRRSRRPARSKGGAERDAIAESAVPTDPVDRRFSLPGVGFLLVPFVGIWFLLALVYPSPVGVFFPAIPDIGFLLAAVAVVLSFGLLRSDRKWSTVARNSVVIGCVGGLVFAGGIGLTAIVAGCPTLSASSVGEIQGWEKADNPSWTNGGAPVLLFYGSTGCPYCSATSWALLAALIALGTVSSAQLQFGNSVEDNIPEVIVNSISIDSPYVSLDAREAQDFSNALAIPALGCTEQAYVSAYNPDQSRPFVVINGQYWHVGTLVDPTTLSGANPQTVYGQVTSQSGGDWQLIAPSAYALEAFLVKANGGLPASLASNPNVHPLLEQLT